jgi:hypothetical protein
MTFHGPGHARRVAAGMPRPRTITAHSTSSLTLSWSWARFAQGYTV